MTVVVPVLRERDAIERCLDAVAAQTYPDVVEVLVVDGGSDDGTREVVERRNGVTLVDNPDRIQAAALNIGLGAARGDVVVRVDGHTVVAPDYVQRCVEALTATGAAMVGGGMTPVAGGGTVQSAIAAAMGSRFGAGPARFHVGGAAGWVDTVYLGAYRTSDARAVGGYAADLAINEDAEFAHRMAARGGVWFDPAIRSTYEPRASLGALARQFHRYGQGRARTALRHPRSMRPRQLAPVALVLGLTFGPRRRRVLLAYAAGIGAATALDGRGDLRQRAVFAAALPTMHLSWGTGFLRTLVGRASSVLVGQGRG